MSKLTTALFGLFRRDPVPRISPAQLRARLDRGDAIALIDLRPWDDVLKSGEKLPRAHVRTAAELFRDRAAGRLPGELILYCS